MAVYFFYGDEDFNIDLEIECMRSKLNQDFISMNFQTHNNPEYSDLINILRTPPMMFGDMLIIINSEKYFSSNKNFFEDSQLSDIENALENNPENLNIVFVYKLPRDENKKPDSRRKLFKILNKFNVKEFPTIKSYKTAELTDWIKKYSKKKNLELNNDAVNLLIEHLGNNLRQYDTELEKLRLLAHPKNLVTKEMVSQIAISNEDLFNITELLMKNKKDKALLEFKKLVDKKHPLEILAAIQTILKKWILLKINAKKLSSFELSKLTGQHEFVVKQNLMKLKNTNVSDLVKLKNDLFDVEFKLKSAESLDIISEVEIALIR